MRVILL